MSATKRPGIVAVASHLWSSPVHAAAINLLDPRPGETVLDLGAGFGAATLHLARRIGQDGRVVAVDPSRLMRYSLRVRRAVHPHRKLVDVRDGTAERLPLPDRSVDAIVAMNLIHLLSDVDATATELARVLRHGGRFLFIEEDLDDPDHRFHHTKPHAPDGPTVDDLAQALHTITTTTATDCQRLGGQPTITVEGHTAR